MPYARPTLTQLVNQALQDITSSDLPGVDGLLKKAVLRVMAYVQAGFAYLHYGYLDYIAQQSVPYTATDENLSGWGVLIGEAQEDATFASGPLSFTGTGSIPAGTAIVRSDNFAYQTNAASTASGTTISVTVTATTAGSAGNADSGTVFLLSSPISGILSAGSASGPIVGGADQEAPDAYKTRVLASYASRPQGGAPSDYITWATAVAGVTRAWVAPALAGPGTVTLFVMLDVSEATNAGFPQGTNGVATNETRATAATGDQLVVANAIYPLRPATVLLYVNAPTAQPTAFSIANLGSNNTSTMQAAIAAALADMFVRLGYVGGTINPTTGAAYAAIDPNEWYAALSAIPGLTTFTVTSPSAPISPATGALLTVGTLTYAT